MKCFVRLNDGWGLEVLRTVSEIAVLGIVGFIPLW
jgi:hypothetical protein